MKMIIATKTRRNRPPTIATSLCFENQAVIPERFGIFDPCGGGVGGGVGVWPGFSVPQLTCVEDKVVGSY